MVQSWVDLVAGFVAGGSVALLLHPLDLVKVRFQVNDGSLAGIRYRGTLDAFRTVVATEGVRGLFKGAVPGAGTVHEGACSAPCCSGDGKVW